MTDDSTSGIIAGQFIGGEELRPTYENVESRGFNQLLKVKRQGRWFMLKGLKPEVQNQTVYLELLKKEYELMVQLDHPNIVKAYAKEENDRIGPCIVMEYIDGVTLDQFLESDPSRQMRHKVMDQLVDALTYVHSKQVLHRDLKPGNILITRNGNNVKIIDFGLSDADDYAILKQSAGTLKYMAPEQLRQEAAIDCKSDLYSFGLLLKRIFPRRYRHVATKCTREDPAKRYADMEAVRKALERQDLTRRMFPFVITLLLAALCVFLLARKPDSSNERAEVAVSDMIPDEQKYYDEWLWYTEQRLRPILTEIKQGKEYREVLISRLSKHIVEMKELGKEMSLLYVSDNPKKMKFELKVSQDLQMRQNSVLETINGNCRSYKEEFQKGLIDQTTYDSLEWLVSAVVSTMPVAGITATTAQGGIDVVGKSYCGGMEMGLCWGVLHNPTVEGKHACCDHLGDSVVMRGLLPETTYFVRAYLSGSAGVVYGNEVAFATLPSDTVMLLPEGALPGIFSVGEGRQVRFAKGNLQYRASTKTWRFAAHQYDVIGQDNEKISETYDGWIDLFGWATSGYDHGAVNWQPWSGNKDTQSNALHYAYGNASYDLDAQDGKADWGYNAISNGGNEEGLWRTMSRDEWVYLLFVRNTASGARFAKAVVNDIPGLVLLPDDWIASTYQLNSVNNVELGFINVITLTDWQRVMEPAKAVFLPEAGARLIDGIYEDVIGYNTSTSGIHANYLMRVGQDHLTVGLGGHRGDGLAVRLVREVE